MRLKKKKTIEDGLIRGMEEALAHSRGQQQLKETVRELPGPAPHWKAKDIRRIRKEVFGMSQPQFAAFLNVSVPTIRAWEQGQKTPSGSAARLIQILETNPERMAEIMTELAAA